MSLETWAINKIQDMLWNDKLSEAEKIENTRAVIVVYNSIDKSK